MRDNSLVRSWVWVYFLMFTSSSPFNATYLRQNITPIVIHVGSRMLRVFLGLVEVRA